MHKENWLFKLANKEETFLYFAFADETYSGDFYRGCILNKPSIRESIDLAKSTAKTSNISITIPDFSYQGSPISEELFGTNHYINQTVSVYSSTTSVTQIGSFRLIDVSTDGSKISLSLTSHRPWDFIDFPQDKTTSMVDIPVVYGNFTKNPYGTGSSFLTSKDLYPCPNINYGINNLVYFVYPKLYGSGAKPHYYDSNIDSFIPFEDASDATSVQSGGNCVGMYVDMEQGYFLIRPFGCSGWTNSSNAIDTNIATPADGSTAPGIADPDETLSDEDRMTITVPMLDTELTELYVYVKGEITHNEISGDTSSALRVNNGTMISRTSSGTTSTSGYTIDGNSGYSRIDALGESAIDINLYTTAEGSLPNTYGDANATGKIYDVVLRLKAKNDITDEKTASYDKASKVEKVYSGADGLTHGVTDGAYNGYPITQINEAHIDLLNRFTGLDPTDLDTDTDLDGWNALNSARSGWDLRWWTLESVELKKILEKLQYEGGFIFRYKADGTPQYIHIPDNPSADATLTKNDISDINVKHTPFSELITKMEINYERHPAEKKYLSSATKQDSTARANWNILTKENIKTVNLDALVSSVATDFDDDPNDGFVAYYANIYGDIKLQVSGTIVNPDYFTLEVGNVLNFTDMYPEKAFGESWLGKDFMITSMSRTIGKTTFEAREI